MKDYAQTNLGLYRQMREAGRGDAELAAAGRAYELAMALFAGIHRASGKPFVAHLVGTASVLVAAEAPLPLVLAGLLHATYVQGNFGDGPPGATPARRARLAREIGAAEELVFRYTHLAWRAGDLSAERDWIDGLDSLDRQVAVVRLANEIEEAVDGGILFGSDGDARKREYLAAAPVWTRWARALSQEALASELEGAALVLEAFRVPETLRSSRLRSFRAEERPTLIGRARRALSRARRTGGHLKRFIRRQPRS